MITLIQFILIGALLATVRSLSSDIIKFRFYKEAYGTWYIDLPDYTGPKGDLAMVAGADDMLDYLAKGNNQVDVEMSEQPIEGALKLEISRLGDPGGGAYYKPVNHQIQSVWLCDVTLFALGKFPENIYFRKAT
ncbi:DUF6717 family protein [Pontibacter rugosus]|uniref:DUF6717 family protein n=1 Tax=Pontibacter rugosus TaxID=1745966 RepID=A0ABW3SQ27_9BACT